METGLVIKTYKMDWSFLIKNYLNPEMWQKRWTLFQYGPYKVTLNIFSIYTLSEQITFDIQIHYALPNKMLTYAETSMCFSLKIDDLTFLKRQINSAIFETMIKVERDLIRRQEDYNELEKMKFKEEEQLENITKNFIESNGVTNEHLIEAYVDAYVDEYAQMPDKIAAYVDSQVYHHFPSFYLTWLDTLEDDPKKEIRTREIKNALSDDEREQVLKDIEEYKKYIETEEFENEMKDKLEEV